MVQKRSYWKGISAVGDSSYGDSGKGKITDLASQETDITVRVGGGANAGHTVQNEFGEFKFHLIPSGIFTPGNINYLASGVLVDPVRLKEEIVELRKRNVIVTKLNLRISENAHGVFAWHKEMDRLLEENRGKNKIGTTHQGIGPAAAQRAGRSGLRMKDLLLPKKKLKEKFDEEIELQENSLRALQKDTSKKSKKRKSQILNQNYIWTELVEAQEVIQSMIGNITPEIWQAQERGKNILLELAQGALLDPLFGSYPFVTSTHPGLAGVTLSTGIHGRDINKAVGVTKAYATRVGGGPMPTELHERVGDIIREVGNEYGATTGRPRRVGWFDIPAIRYGMRVGGFDRVALTKSDVLDQLKDIQVCVGYIIDGKEYNNIPTMDPEVMGRAKPIFKYFKGWQKDTSKIQSYKDLPNENKNYILFLQKELGYPIEIVSVGPDRDQTIYRADD